MRAGECDDDTEAYFSSLGRDCKPCDDSDGVVHIYLRKLAVYRSTQYRCFVETPGHIITLKSTDTGCAQYLEKTTSNVLTLKEGCNVMLLYNINQHL